MRIKVKAHSEFEKSAKFKTIHGKFPYKYYYSVFGASKTGRFIVIVSDKKSRLENENDIIVEITSGRKLDSQNNMIYRATKVDPAVLNNEDIEVYVEV